MRDCTQKHLVHHWCTSMNLVHGFIQLSLMGWLAVGASVVFIGMGIALKVQTARLDSVKSEYSIFKAEVKRIGEESERKAKEDEKRRNAVYKSSLARLERDNVRLRNSTSQSVLPSTGDTQTACFGRAELESALSVFVRGTEELIIEGDRAIAGLDSLR